MYRDDDNTRTDTDILELTLLLPGRQLTILEAAAQRQGITSGQLLRQMIHDYLERAFAARPLATG